MVNVREWLRDAMVRGYGIPALNTQGGNYDLVRAIVETAAEEQAPVILMAYAANTAYYGLDWLPFLTEKLSSQFGIPLVSHLDHGDSVDTVVKGLGAGYSSVMIDHSTRPLGENIDATRQVLAAAAPSGAAVEAEIGELLRTADANDSATAANLVDPGQVATFLDACPVDMLAVGIGNAHGFYTGAPRIRLDLLEEVRNVAGDTALVLHGTTGIPEETVSRCIRLGMVKINFGTILRTSLLKYVTDGINGAAEHNGHIWRVCAYARTRLKEDVRTIIRSLGSSGKL